MKVLVTGGGGYIGSILCEHLLDAGHEVTVLDQFVYGQHSLFHLAHYPNLKVINGDARDRSTVSAVVEKVDVIIPATGVVGAPACDRDPVLATQLNTDAVLMVADLKSPDQLLILPMTNSGYGTHTGEVYCTEDTPLEPVSHYGRTKVAAEAGVLEKPNSISFRLATVFGMSPRLRIDLLVNFFTYKAVTEKNIVIFEKDFHRNYIHIRDVADCFNFALDNPDGMVGEAFNVGLDDANLNKEELAYKIREHVPDFYIHFAEFGSDPDKRDYIVSNEKLRAAGFTPTRSIDAGIKELIKGYEMLSVGPLRNG